MPAWRCLFVAILMLFPAMSLAGQGGLLQNASAFNSRGSLFAQGQPPDGGEGPRRTASLFIGKRGGSFFAPFPPRQDLAAVMLRPMMSDSHSARILDLIAQAEAGRHGYDAVQHGASRRPPGKPTEMTIQQIYDWIAQTPGQPHAIGRYQFIPPTLKHLVARLGIGADTVFSPQVQDRLAGALLADAGLPAIKAGEIERHVFMHNLAKIWAGLPTSDGTSYYHGLAGNRATMTWAHFDAEMGKIFPG